MFYQFLAARNFLTLASIGVMLGACEFPSNIILSSGLSLDFETGVPVLVERESGGSSGTETYPPSVEIDGGKKYCREDEDHGKKVTTLLEKGKKILICHVTPSGERTLLINEAGWLHGHEPQHLSDYLGSCGENSEPSQDSEEGSPPPNYSEC